MDDCMRPISMNPIGVIHTPYNDPKGMPIQGTFDVGVQGSVSLFPPFVAGLKDIDGFSHLMLFYHLNRSTEERITAKPFLEDIEHGIFASRFPHRPNHIGFSIVKLETVTADGFTFSEVDMLDGTPLLDIKPHVNHFDSRSDVRCGWYDAHFENGNIPKRTKCG